MCDCVGGPQILSPWAWRQRSPAMGMGNVASPRPSVWVRWRTYGALGLRGLTAVNIHDFRSPSPPLKNGRRAQAPCHDRGEPAPARSVETRVNAPGYARSTQPSEAEGPRGGGSTGHGIGNKNNGQNANRIFAGRSFRSPDPNALTEQERRTLRCPNNYSATRSRSTAHNIVYKQHVDTEYTHTYHIGICV